MAIPFRAPRSWQPFRLPGLEGALNQVARDAAAGGRALQQFVDRGKSQLRVPNRQFRAPSVPAPVANAAASSVGQGLVRNAANLLLRPSSLFAATGVPGWAKAAVPLALPVGTSVAGTLVGLSQLQGSTPQSDDPLDNWQRLGYKSKEDMRQKMFAQGAKENDQTWVNRANAERPVGTQATLGGQPVYWAGKDYGWQRLKGNGSSTTLNALNTGSTQNRFIQEPVIDAKQPANADQQTLGPETFGSTQPRVQEQQIQVSTPEQLAQLQLADLVKQIGSPQDVSNLAFQTSAPLSFKTIGGKQIEPSLSDYYGAQAAYGRQTFKQGAPGLDQVMQQLGYDENMQKWALANPMLAQREYAKLLAKGTPSIAAPSSQPSSPPGMGLKGNWIDESPLNPSGGLA